MENIYVLIEALKMDYVQIALNNLHVFCIVLSVWFIVLAYVLIYDEKLVYHTLVQWQR